eukprot:9928361-Ditylum_brightwellii.AAC.1
MVGRPKKVVDGVTFGCSLEEGAPEAGIVFDCICSLCWFSLVLFKKVTEATKSVLSLGYNWCSEEVGELHHSKGDLVLWKYDDEGSGVDDPAQNCLDLCKAAITKKFAKGQDISTGNWFYFVERAKDYMDGKWYCCFTLGNVGWDV